MFKPFKLKKEPREYIPTRERLPLLEPLGQFCPIRNGIQVTDFVDLKSETHPHLVLVAPDEGFMDMWTVQAAESVYFKWCSRETATKLCFQVDEKTMIGAFHNFEGVAFQSPVRFRKNNGNLVIISIWFSTERINVGKNLMSTQTKDIQPVIKFIKASLYARFGYTSDTTMERFAYNRNKAEMQRRSFLSEFVRLENEQREIALREARNKPFYQALWETDCTIEGCFTAIKEVNVRPVHTDFMEGQESSVLDVFVSQSRLGNKQSYITLLFKRSAGVIRPKTFLITDLMESLLHSQQELVSKLIEGVAAANPKTVVPKDAFKLAIAHVPDFLNGSLGNSTLFKLLLDHMLRHLCLRIGQTEAQAHQLTKSHPTNPRLESLHNHLTSLKNIAAATRARVWVSNVDNLVSYMCRPYDCENPLLTFEDWAMHLTRNQMGKLGRPILTVASLVRALHKTCLKVAVTLCTRYHFNPRLPVNSFVDFSLSTSPDLSLTQNPRGERLLAGLSFMGISEFSSILLTPITVVSEPIGSGVERYGKVGDLYIDYIFRGGNANKFLHRQFGIVKSAMNVLHGSSEASLRANIDKLTKGYLPAHLNTVDAEGFDIADDTGEPELDEDVDWAEFDFDSDSDVDEFELSEISDRDATSDIMTISDVSQDTVMDAVMYETTNDATMSNVESAFRIYCPDATLILSLTGTEEVEPKTLTVRNSKIVFDKQFVLGSESSSSKRRIVAFVCDEFETITHASHSINPVTALRPKVGYPFYSFEVDPETSVNFNSATPFDSLMVSKVNYSLLLSIGKKAKWVVDLENIRDLTIPASANFFRKHNGSFLNNMSVMSIRDVSWFFYPSVRSAVKFKISQFCPMAIVKRHFSERSLRAEPDCREFSLDLSESGFAGQKQMTWGDDIDQVELARIFAVNYIKVLSFASKQAKTDLLQKLQSGSSASNDKQLSLASNTRTVQADVEATEHIVAKSAFGLVEVGSCKIDSFLQLGNMKFYIEIKTTTGSNTSAYMNYVKSRQFANQDAWVRTMRNSYLVCLVVSRGDDPCIRKFSFYNGPHYIHTQVIFSSAGWNCDGNSDIGCLDPANFPMALGNPELMNTDDSDDNESASCVWEQLATLGVELLADRYFKHLADVSYNLTEVGLSGDLLPAEDFSKHLADLLCELVQPTSDLEKQLVSSFKAYMSYDSYQAVRDSITNMQPKKLIESIEHEASSTCPSFNQIVPLSLTSRLVAQWALILCDGPNFSSNREVIWCILRIGFGPLNPQVKSERSEPFLKELLQAYHSRIDNLSYDYVKGLLQSTKNFAIAALAWMIGCGAIVLSSDANSYLFKMESKPATFNEAATGPTALSATSGPFETCRVGEQPQAYNFRRNAVLAAADSLALDKPDGFTKQQFRLTEVTPFCAEPTENLEFKSQAITIAMFKSQFRLFSNYFLEGKHYQLNTPGKSAIDSLQMFLTSVFPHMAFWYSGELCDLAFSYNPPPEVQSVLSRIKLIRCLQHMTGPEVMVNRAQLLPIFSALGYSALDTCAILRMMKAESCCTLVYMCRWLAKREIMTDPVLSFLLCGCTTTYKSKLENLFDLSVSCGAIFTKLFPKSVAELPPSTALNFPTKDLKLSSTIKSLTVEEVTEAVRAAVVKSLHKEMNREPTLMEIEARFTHVTNPTDNKNENALSAIKRNAALNKLGAEGQNIPRMQYLANFTRDMEVIHKADVRGGFNKSSKCPLENVTPNKIHAAASEMYRLGQNSICKLVSETHWGLSDKISELTVAYGVGLSTPDRPHNVCHSLYTSLSNPRRREEILSKTDQLHRATDLPTADNLVRDLANLCRDEFNDTLLHIAKTMLLTILVSSNTLLCDLSKSGSVAIRNTSNSARRSMTIIDFDIFTKEDLLSDEVKLHKVCRQIISQYITWKNSSLIKQLCVGSSPGAIATWNSAVSESVVSLSYRSDKQEVWILQSTGLTVSETVMLASREAAKLDSIPEMRPNWNVVNVEALALQLYSDLTGTLSASFRENFLRLHSVLTGPMTRLTQPQMKTMQTTAFRAEIADDSVFISEAADSAFACSYLLSLLKRSSAMAFEVNYQSMKMCTGKISMADRDFKESLCDPSLFMGTCQALRLFMCHFILSNYKARIDNDASDTESLVTCKSDITVSYLGNASIKVSDMLGYCQALQATGVNEAGGNVQTVQGAKKWIKELSAIFGRDYLKLILARSALGPSLDKDDFYATFIPLEIAASFFYKHCPSIFGRRAIMERNSPGHKSLIKETTVSYSNYMTRDAVNASRNAGAVGSGSLKSSAGVYALWEPYSQASSRSMKYAAWLKELGTEELRSRVVAGLRTVLELCQVKQKQTPDLYLQFCRTIGMPDEFIVPNSVRFANIEYMENCLQMLSFHSELAEQFVSQKTLSKHGQFDLFSSLVSSLDSNLAKQMEDCGYDFLRGLMLNLAHITAKHQKLGGRPIATQDLITGLMARMDQHVSHLSKIFKDWLPAFDMATNDYSDVRDLMGEVAAEVAKGDVKTGKQSINPIFSEDAVLANLTIGAKERYITYYRHYQDYTSKSVKDMALTREVCETKRNLVVCEFLMSALKNETPCLSPITAIIADCAKFSATDLHTTPGLFGPILQAMNMAFAARTMSMPMHEVLSRKKDDSGFCGPTTMANINKGWVACGQVLASWQQGLQTVSSSLLFSSSATAMNSFCVDMKAIAGQSSDDKMGMYVYGKAAAEARRQLWNACFANNSFKLEDLKNEFDGLVNKVWSAILSEEAKQAQLSAADPFYAATAVPSSECDEPCEDVKQDEKYKVKYKNDECDTVTTFLNLVKIVFAKLGSNFPLETFLADVGCLSGFTDSPKKSLLGGMILEVIYKLNVILAQISEGSCLSPVNSNGYALASSGGSINAMSSCLLATTGVATQVTALNVTKNTVKLLEKSQTALQNLCLDWRVNSPFGDLFAGINKPGVILPLSPMIAFSKPYCLFGENLEMSSLWLSVKLAKRLNNNFQESALFKELLDNNVHLMNSQVGISSEISETFIQGMKLILREVLASQATLDKTETVLGPKSNSIVALLEQNMKLNSDLSKLEPLELTMRAVIGNLWCVTSGVTSQMVARDQLGSSASAAILRIFRRIYGTNVISQLPAAVPASSAMTDQFIPPLTKQLNMQHKKNTEVVDHIARHLLANKYDFQRGKHVAFSIRKMTSLLVGLKPKPGQNMGLVDSRSFGPARVMDVLDSLSMGNLASKFTHVFNDLIKGGLMIGTNLLGLNVANLTHKPQGLHPNLAWIYGDMSSSLEEIAPAWQIAGSTPLQVRDGLLDQNSVTKCSIQTPSAAGDIPIKLNNTYFARSNTKKLSQFSITSRVHVASKLSLTASRVTSAARYADSVWDAKATNSLGLHMKRNPEGATAQDAIAKFFAFEGPLILRPAVDDGISGPMCKLDMPTPTMVANSDFVGLNYPPAFSSTILEQSDQELLSSDLQQVSVSITELQRPPAEVLTRCIEIQALASYKNFTWQDVQIGLSKRLFARCNKPGVLFDVPRDLGSLAQMDLSYDSLIQLLLLTDLGKDLIWCVWLSTQVKNKRAEQDFHFVVPKLCRVGNPALFPSRLSNILQDIKARPTSFGISHVPPLQEMAHSIEPQQLLELILLTVADDRDYPLREMSMSPFSPAHLVEKSSPADAVWCMTPGSQVNVGSIGSLVLGASNIQQLVMLEPDTYQEMMRRIVAGTSLKGVFLSVLQNRVQPPPQVFDDQLLQPAVLLYNNEQDLVWGHFRSKMSQWVT